MGVISVTCALILLDDKVLCAKRSESMSLPGMWEFPGGKIEESESPEVCLIREIKEELGIKVKVFFSFKSNVHVYSPTKTVRLIPFVCGWESGEIVLLEHEEIKWLTQQELKSLDWAAADIPIVEDLVANWNNIQKQLVAKNRDI